MNENQTKLGLMSDSKIDWVEIKSKVNSLQNLIVCMDILSEEEKHVLLKKRAQALSVETKDVKNQGDIIEIVVFRLATETYGLESKYVREVYPLKAFTVLPGTPNFLLGIINVRGQIISVIDLKKFFNLPEKGIGELNKVIILRNEKMEFGILADIIQSTQSIFIEEIQATPVSVEGIGAGYIKGITKDRIIVLDAAAILKDENIIIHRESE